MADEGDDIISFNYTDEDRRVPRDATHITIAKSVTVIPAWTFDCDRNIVKVVCDENVKKVERVAFSNCPSLRRVIMPGVEIVEGSAFAGCESLTHVECGKLEIMRRRAFMDCTALERITIPLKDGIITDDNIFTGCDNLKQVDLVEGELHETIAALQLEEWRNDMNEEIDSINQILPSVDAGFYDYGFEDDDGEKARAIRTWIRSVLGKVIHYQAEHQRLLDEQVTTTLQHSLPQDIVMNNVFPFLELPSYTFEVDDYEEGEEQDHLDSEEEDDAKSK